MGMLASTLCSSTFTAGTRSPSTDAVTTTRPGPVAGGFWGRADAAIGTTRHTQTKSEVRRDMSIHEERRGTPDDLSECSEKPSLRIVRFGDTPPTMNDS